MIIFDGDCGFCRYCVEYARAVTDVEAGGGVRYEPYQRVAAQYPDIAVEEFKASIRLITPAARYSGAAAAFHVLALAPRLRGWLWCYRFVPLFAVVAEMLYRFTARHRGAVYQVARPLFGARLLPADYTRTSGIVIRGIGLASLFAFTSWWWQAAGLIGSQGILQGTFETFGAVARTHFNGTLAGRFVLTAGLGGMGGAQPLAVTMNGGVALCIDVDPTRIERRIKTRYLDRETDDLETALAWTDEARAGGEAVSVGLLGNCAEVEPELLRRGWRPDIVTDQTSAHDPLGGYVPAGLSLEEAASLRVSDPTDYQRRAYASMAHHVGAMVGGNAVKILYPALTAWLSKRLAAPSNNEHLHQPG